MSDESNADGAMRRYLTEKKRAAMQSWRAASEKSTDPAVRAAFAVYASVAHTLDALNKVESTMEDDE